MPSSDISAQSCNQGPVCSTLPVNQKKCLMEKLEANERKILRKIFNLINENCEYR